MSKLLLSLTIIVGALFVGVSPALATEPTPPEPLLCTGVGAPSANVRQYNTGVILGRQVVRQAWASSSQEPDYFEDFTDLVRGTLRNAIRNLHNGPTEPSAPVKCRAKGMSQGFCDALSDIQDEVASVCLLDGQMWGVLSGDIYCALASEFGGASVFDLMPVLPTNLCGTNFVNGCVGGFQDYAYELATCEPYTDEPVTSGPEKEFVDAYLSWQGGMCSYEIP